jgi:hypothetical protein
MLMKKNVKNDQIKLALPKCYMVYNWYSSSMKADSHFEDKFKSLLLIDGMIMSSKRRVSSSVETL